MKIMGRKGVLATEIGGKIHNGWGANKMEGTRLKMNPEVKAKSHNEKLFLLFNCGINLAQNSSFESYSIAI
jgi:hypothetical protein